MLRETTNTTSQTDTVLYLPGLEIRKPATGNLVYTRYYTIAGSTIAVRTGSTGDATDPLAWLINDTQSTATMTITNGTNTATLQTYYPYGTKRGGDTLTLTDRGFTGQTEDPTGLDYLNNRYYDPTTGVFLSVDPLVAKTGEPYLYAAGNPTTLSDPSGLDPGCRVGVARGECWSAHFSWVGSAPSSSVDGGPVSSGDVLSTTSGSWVYTGKRYGTTGRLNGAQPPTLYDGMGAYPCGGDVTCAHDGLGEWVTAGATIDAASLALGISWEAAMFVCSLHPVGCMTAAGIAVDAANGAPVNIATPAPALATGIGIDAAELSMTRTVEQHIGEYAKNGTLARPSADSRLTIQSIMDAVAPIHDPGGVPGAWRWDVPGTMNGTSGTWELVVDPQSKTILHFLFKGGS